MKASASVALSRIAQETEQLSNLIIFEQYKSLQGKPVPTRLDSSISIHGSNSSSQDSILSESVNTLSVPKSTKGTILGRP